MTKYFQFPEFSINGSVSSGELLMLQKKYDCKLPETYIQFLSRTNGGEGFIGKSYLVVWRADQVVRYNTEYEFPKYAKGFVCFGSNGGGEAYAFDCRDGVASGVVQIPFIGMSPDEALPVAETFEKFIASLKEGKHL